MKKYFVGFNYTVGGQAGTSGGNEEWVYGVPGHLAGGALTAHLKKSIEAAGAPRIVSDIKILETVG